MKIQKFGTISFTERGCPLPNGFNFEFQSEAEHHLIQKDEKYKTVLFIEALAIHLQHVAQMARKTVDDLYQDDSGDFNEVQEGFILSPKEVVLESLTRIMAK
jgi:hypothetical protein